ncbi:MAG: glycosyltransferase family 4 protein [Ginsengibacter sp.]
MSKSGKILLILNLPPPYGGGEIRSEYLYKRLNGNEDYIIISNSRKKSNKSTQGKLTFYNIFFGIKIFAKAVYYIVFFRPKKLFLGIPKQFKPFTRTALIIGVASVFRIKINGELAGDSFVFLNKDNYQKKIGLFFLRKITEIRVLGESIKNKLSQFQICKLVVIDNGIYVPKNIKSCRDNFSNPLKLLFVGAVNYSKGIKNLVECANLLKKEDINIRLDIMGEWSNTSQKEEIINYIKNNRLEDIITFHGLVTTEEKWKTYENNSILVHPTFWDGQPLVILEAMGCGLAIISTKVGAIPDTMQNDYNGTILPENNPTELCNAIKKYYNNREMIKTVSKNNIKTYHERYTIDSYILRMIKWLEA